MADTAKDDHGQNGSELDINLQIQEEETKTTDATTINTNVKRKKNKSKSADPMKQKLLPNNTTINDPLLSQPDDLLLFADPEQLRKSVNPNEIILSLEQQAIIQINHGKCDTSNFIMDFQTNIGINTKLPNCRIVNGIRSGKLSIKQRKEIKNIPFKIWRDILEEQNRKKKENDCCPDCECKCKIPYQYIFIPLIMIIIILFIFYVIIHDVTEDWWWWLGIIVSVFLLIITAISWYNNSTSSPKKTVDELLTDTKLLEFRGQFLQKMMDIMDNKLKCEYPDLLFTLIYPIKMDNGDLWCYLRVTEGIIDLDDFEPLLYRTCDEDDIKFEEYNEHCTLQVMTKEFGDGKSGSDKLGKMVDNAGNALDAASTAVDLFKTVRKIK